MPRPTTTPKEWKAFHLSDGTTRQLPGWADKPLGFALDPDEALRRCAHKRLPTGHKKSVKTRLKSQ
jgi:hypothetical protein